MKIYSKKKSHTIVKLYRYFVFASSSGSWTNTQRWISQNVNFLETSDLTPLSYHDHCKAVITKIFCCSLGKWWTSFPTAAAVHVLSPYPSLITSAIKIICVNLSILFLPCLLNVMLSITEQNGVLLLEASWKFYKCCDCACEKKVDGITNIFFIDIVTLMRKMLRSFCIFLDIRFALSGKKRGNDLSYVGTLKYTSDHHHLI